MKNKFPLFLFLILAGINLLSNSCKKKEVDANIARLFTNGVWQLASVQVYNYEGDAQIGLPDTLNSGCQIPQTFTFNDNTCTYENFDCQTQTTTGKWTLTQNRLFFKKTA